MATDLPLGLEGAWSALTMVDDRDAHDRLTSIVWTRLLLDPTCPNVGGQDPRTFLQFPLPWDLHWDGVHLDRFGDRMNMIMGQDLLSTDWSKLPELTVKRVVDEIRRWRPQPEMGDQLGYISQRVRSNWTKSGLGAFYTPYSISLLMAKMVGVEPGKSVLDPCCGSGGMLLAALQACREDHNGIPEVFGIDIDPVACRLAKLNLTLAGIAPGERIQNRNALVMTPPEQLSPIQREMQLALFEWEANGGTPDAVGWRLMQSA